MPEQIRRFSMLTFSSGPCSVQVFGGCFSPQLYLISYVERLASPQQGDLRLSGPPSGQGASSGARTCDRRVPADLRADSQATVLPTPPEKEGRDGLRIEMSIRWVRERGPWGSERDGQKERENLGSSVHPSYMNITEDGYLMCSTWENKIARVEVGTGTVAFDKSVPQIQDPCGVTITSDGSILVTDRDKKKLHLVSSQGVWIKQLWSVPSGGDWDDVLTSVSTDGSVCVCVTERGCVYILDCL
ncbi:hypothetical protein PoB_003627300 [Plakobranchus ocellatus]|uniref:Uncharacterized protein n=1 Tax=Plakobranchus ocellatus TaxID=259542 RepID=A0AAV4ASI5_9GAST|nr:hypothetical protein PoB_003627300 [Plakobranchus ocellatus]